ncbi:MAG: hypothetical protein AB1626_05475, partial [Candidatus Micrarchaeota archaeon]
EPVYLQQYFRAVHKRRIRERVIIKEGAKKIPEAKTTQYRELSSKWLGDTPAWIYGNKFCLTIPGAPPTAVMVESRAVAESQRKQFELLWKLAKEAKQ